VQLSRSLEPQHQLLTDEQSKYDEAVANEARKPVAKVVEMYPSLAAPPRERLIPMSARIPLSMLEDLEKICDESKIDVSALVRDFIAAGLRSLKRQ
jgi:hypothetical protein